MVMPYYFDLAIGALRSIPPKEDPFDMDSAEHGSSETSSMDDQLGKINSEISATGSRSYDCSFCKRGFTNAQALGGHMNIHRKDKAKLKPKAKHRVADPSPVLTNKISTNLEECVACVYFAPNSSQQLQYCAALGAQMNYQMRFRAPNPSFPHAAYHTAHLTADSEEYTGADLRLQIGEEGMKEDRQRNRNGNEIDLELRLGHNP